MNETPGKSIRYFFQEFLHAMETGMKELIYEREETEWDECE